MSNFYTDEKFRLLKSKSAFSLPDNPSDRGFNAQQIKTFLYEPSLQLFKWLQERDTTIDGSLTDVEKQLAEHLGLINKNKEDIRLNGVDIKLNTEKINRLDTEAVKVVHQDLTEEQKKQARLNLDVDNLMTIYVNDFSELFDKVKEVGIYRIVKLEQTTHNTSFVLYVAKRLYNGKNVLVYTLTNFATGNASIFTADEGNKTFIESNLNKEGICWYHHDGRSYLKGSVVAYNGSAFISLVGNNTEEPSPTAKNWLDITTVISNKEKGQPNGVATLDKDGFIPTSQLPNGLDDIIDGTYINETTFNGTDGKPVVPKNNVIYYDTKTFKRYGWSGTAFVSLGTDVIFGDTKGTAYEGNKGKKNADDIITINDNLARFLKDITDLQNNKLDKKPIYLPHGTDLYTFNWNAYENGTYFAGTDFVNIPVEMKDHKDVVIQLIKQNESGRYALVLYHTGVYENNTGLYINFHYSDKFKGWESLIGGGAGGITIDQVNELINSNNDKVILKTEKGVASGVATLDADGKIPVEQLPDDHKEVIRGTSNDLYTEFTDTTGKVWKAGVEDIETKIFIDNVRNIQFVWSGNKFIATGSNLALGETENTAYAGNKGKANAEAIKTINTNLDNKVDKIKQQYMLYGTNGLGDQTEVQYNQEPIGGGVAQRTSDGRVKTTDPKEYGDSVNLHYFNANKDIVITPKTDNTISREDWFNYIANDKVAYIKTTYKDMFGITYVKYFRKTRVLQDKYNNIYKAFFFINQFNDYNSTYEDLELVVDEPIGNNDASFEINSANREVIANNGEAPTAYLTTLKVGPTNYKVAGGGDTASVEGTTAIFSPQGKNDGSIIPNNGQPTTQNLTSLQVGKTNYGIGGIDLSTPYATVDITDGALDGLYEINKKLTKGEYLLTFTDENDSFDITDKSSYFVLNDETNNTIISSSIFYIGDATTSTNKLCHCMIIYYVNSNASISFTSPVDESLIGNDNTCKINSLTLYKLA